MKLVICEKPSVGAAVAAALGVREKKDGYIEGNGYAVKADKERGKGAKPEKKPSIRAQLRADKEKAQKKNAKQKSQDLERS